MDESGPSGWFHAAPFTLRRFLRAHRAALLVAFVLVVLETLAQQAGPLLTQIGIDRGVLQGSRGALSSEIHLNVISS